MFITVSGECWKIIRQKTGVCKLIPSLSKSFFKNIFEELKFRINRKYGCARWLYQHTKLCVSFMSVTVQMLKIICHQYIFLLLGIFNLARAHESEVICYILTYGDICIYKDKLAALKACQQYIVEQLKKLAGKFIYRVNKKGRGHCIAIIWFRKETNA